MKNTSTLLLARSASEREEQKNRVQSDPAHAPMLTWSSSSSKKLTDDPFQTFFIDSNDCSSLFVVGKTTHSLRNTPGDWKLARCFYPTSWISLRLSTSDECVRWTNHRLSDLRCSTNANEELSIAQSAFVLSRSSRQFFADLLFNSTTTRWQIVRITQCHRPARW